MQTAKEKFDILFNMDRNLALEFVRVTEAASIAAAEWIGLGDGKAADQAAVDQMRTRFNQIDFSARIAIGEGKKDEAAELYVGEEVGSGKSPRMDLAVGFRSPISHSLGVRKIFNSAHRNRHLNPSGF